MKQRVGLLCIAGLCSLSPLLASSLFFGEAVIAGSHSNASAVSKIAKVSFFRRSGWLDINRLKFHLNNRGGLATDPGNGVAGAFWPDTAWDTEVVFDCGPWVVGKLNDVPMMGLSQ